MSETVEDQEQSVAATDKDRERKTVSESSLSGEEKSDDGSSESSESHSVSEMLKDVEKVAGESDDALSIGQVMDAIGRHSFGPLLLAVGLFLSVPGPSDIPGVPTILGLFVLLLSSQIILGRDHVWIPDWLERREVSSDGVQTAVHHLQKHASKLDSIAEPRWQAMVNHAGVTTICIACILIAMSTPLMELIPLSANLAGFVFAAFGLALLANDGLIASVAILLSVAFGGFLGMSLFG